MFVVGFFEFLVYRKESLRRKLIIISEFAVLFHSNPSRWGRERENEQSIGSKISKYLCKLARNSFDGFVYEKNKDILQFFNFGRIDYFCSFWSMGDLTSSERNQK